MSAPLPAPPMSLGLGLLAVLALALVAWACTPPAAAPAGPVSDADQQSVAAALRGEAAPPVAPVAAPVPDAPGPSASEPTAPAPRPSAAPAPTAEQPAPTAEARPFWETAPLPDRETLRRTLTPMQFRVTMEDGTEPPFQNPYDALYEPGLYVDLVSGEPLFSSIDKFDSGTGWPSFTRPLDAQHVRERRDPKYLGFAIEVRSARADTHLGHVFTDGPAPTGLRYCMNSAALRFVPAARLDAEGYGRYASLFQ